MKKSNRKRAGLVSVVCVASQLERPSIQQTSIRIYGSSDIMRAA